MGFHERFNLPDDDRQQDLNSMKFIVQKVFCLLVVYLSRCIIVQAEPDPSVRFIENKNQWNDGSLYGAEISGGRVRVFNNKFKFTLMAPEDIVAKDSKKEKIHSVHPYEHWFGSDTWKVHVYEMHFEGANPSPRIAASNSYATLYNYFFGNDKSSWASGAHAYSTVYYEDLYEGIDLKTYSQHRDIKYEWIVRQDADPGMIRMKYYGLDGMYVRDGNIHLETSVGEGRELRPYAYQWKNGHKINVKCEYVLAGNEVSYIFPQGYDECYELVIDPILIFSAYSGSTLDNWGNTATYDRYGNAYSGGMVMNPDNIEGFPVTPGAYQVNFGGGTWDLGILKYDSSGSELLYATYIGGNNTEAPQSLVVNNNDELLILGTTGSRDFPVTNNSAFSGGDEIDPLGGVEYDRGTDIFVAKLSADGSELAGTYIGGSENDGVNFISGSMRSSINKSESPLSKNYGDQARGDIIADQDNFVYFVSCTRSGNLPALNTGTTYHGGSLDAIVFKLSPDLSSIVWGKYAGGSGTDALYSIKLYENKIYVGGGTTSILIPGMNGLHTVNQGGIDGWVQSLTIDGEVVDGTFLGTPGYDQSYMLDINQTGDVYIFGQTSGNYPVQGNVYFNQAGGQFIHKLSADLKSSIFSTVIGSGGNSPDISPTAFLVNECNNLYLSGWGGATNAPVLQFTNGVSITRNYIGGNTHNLPVTPDAFQSTTSGNDFYFMVLSADASQFLYGTYLGGTMSATHVDGGTSRFDKQGIVYHAVCAGCGGESDFPAVNVPTEHRFNRSTNCNNAVFKFDLAQLRARFQTNSEWYDMPGLNKICIPDKIVFQNRSVGGEIFEWDLGDGTKIILSDTSEIIHQYKDIGTYLVKLKVIDTRTCKGVDETSMIVEVFLRQSVVQENDVMCEKAPYTLQASGGVLYHWITKDSSFTSNLPSPPISPKKNTAYMVHITEASGCIVRDTVNIGVIPKVDVSFDISREAGCINRPVVHVVDNTPEAEDAQLVFDFGDGTTSDAPESVHEYKNDGIYQVKLSALREFCVFEKEASVYIYTISVPNIITPGRPEGQNDTFIVRYGPPEEEKTPADYGLKVSLVVYNRWGKKVFEDHDYQYNWSGEGLSNGVYYYDVDVEGHDSCRSWVHVVR